MSRKDESVPTRATPEQLGAADQPSQRRPPPGHLETFALLGAAAGAVPMPWVPSVLARRVRGALVRDIAARHGIALAHEARSTLADPSSTRQAKGALAQAFAYLGRKVLVRYGPLAVVPPLRAGLETYVLGHLFDRYLSHMSKGVGSRLELAEARRIDEAIERAVVGVANLQSGLDWPRPPDAPEDGRDELTQAVDGLLSATATVPGWLLRRLDLAFDDALGRA